MAVNLKAPESLFPVPGIRLGVAEAAIKKPGRNDLVVIELAEGSAVAGVFTQNAFAAPPVQLCRERLIAGKPIRALLVNSGNANAATGRGGLNDARVTSGAVAAALGCAGEQVLPFSTGVIGTHLPVDRMTGAIPGAIESLREDGWLDAARAIMTTDTVPKGCSRRVRTSQGEITVTGIAKGVGMINPDMATLLAFVGTDARVAPGALKKVLADAVALSFNCVTVDGDTSTNDACMLLASGRAGGREIEADDADFGIVARAVNEVCTQLAQSVARDGEGATRFVTLNVDGAANAQEARQVAQKVANSPLVKTALFAGDANWGRLIMAIGNAGVPGLDPAKVDVSLDGVTVLRGGEPHPDYQEERGARVLAQPEYTISIGLGRGAASVTVWTCDLSYDYVKINAEYRT